MSREPAHKPARKPAQKPAQEPVQKKQTEVLEEEYRYKEYDSEIAGRLFSYLKPYAWWVVAAAVIMASTALVNLSRPWIVSQVLDNGIAARNARLRNNTSFFPEQVGFLQQEARQ